MVVNTRVRATPESVVGDEEIQHQRNRTRRIHEVTRQLDVFTSLTPAPSHLLRFYFVGSVKEVSNLINHPVVSLFGTRVGGTGGNMLAIVTTSERFFGTLPPKEGIYNMRMESVSNLGHLKRRQLSRP